MATVTIRNLDDKVVAALKARAKLNKRSLEAELRHTLRLITMPVDRRQFRARTLEIAAMTPNVPQSDSAELRHEPLADLEPRLVARLKRRAELHGRSLDEELRDILNRSLPYTPEERMVVAQRIAAMTPRGVQQTDSTQLIREDRDRR